MHALLFAGLLLSVAVVLLLLAGFFVHAWLHRRQEVESLLFGLTTLCFAGYTGSGWLLFQRIADGSNLVIRPWLDVCVACSIAAVAFLIHFGLRYGQVRAERSIMTGVYVVMALFLLLLASDRWWQQVGVDVVGLDVLGLQVPLLMLRLTPLALVYHFAAPIGIAVVCALLGRDVLRGRPESRAAVIGAAVLTATAVNDALGLGAGWVDTIPLLPAGCVALVYGVSHTLLSRYGRLSSNLERQTVALHRRSVELAASMAERERTQEELVERERLATVGELAGVIAGEVRAPLRIVNHAIAELDRGNPARADLAVLLDSIKREMTHLDELVTGLLDYARPLVVHEAPIDLQQLLERAVAQVQEGTSLRCTIVNEGAWPALTGDAGLLGRALANLLSHRAQAWGSAGELTLQVGRKALGDVPWTAIEIVDARAATASGRAAQPVASPLGANDGLAALSLPLAVRIVEAHGGTVTLTSEARGGTRASVLLPRPAADGPPGGDHNEDRAATS